MSDVGDDTYAGTSKNTDGNNIDTNIKNLSTVTNLSESKKSVLTKSKKSKLYKSKSSSLSGSNFAKAYFLGGDFLSFKVKDAFMYL